MSLLCSISVPNLSLQKEVSKSRTGKKVGGGRVDEYTDTQRTFVYAHVYLFSKSTPPLISTSSYLTNT